MTEAARAWAAPPSSFPQGHSASEHPATIAVNCVRLWAYLDLFCASVSKMCLKVSEKLRRGYFGGLGKTQNFFPTGASFPGGGDQSGAPPAEPRV